MPGRLHLRNRQAATEIEPTDAGAVYGDGSGGATATDATPVSDEPEVVAPGEREERADETRRVVVPSSGTHRQRSANVGLSAGLGVVGLLTILIGAWGGIVPYIGPTFGYHANSAGSWYWDWQHSLLYLIPGAVVVLTGLWIWGMAARTHSGSGRFGSGLGGLVLLAAGAWFVLGPVVWPIFYSSPVFGPASPTHNFLNQLGYNLGPGLIVAALGGMTLASAATSRRRTAVVER